MCLSIERRNGCMVLATGLRQQKYHGIFRINVVIMKSNLHRYFLHLFLIDLPLFSVVSTPWPVTGAFKSPPCDRPKQPANISVRSGRFTPVLHTFPRHSCPLPVPIQSRAASTSVSGKFPFCSSGSFAAAVTRHTRVLGRFKA